MIRQFFATLALIPSLAIAYCPDHPSLDEEFKTSVGVVLVKVSKELALSEDKEDPIGVTAYLYNAEVLESLHGSVLGKIQIRIENTSSRFPLSVGQKYVLFLRNHGPKTFWVDSCGNSAPLAGSKKLVKQLRSIGAKQ